MKFFRKFLDLYINTSIHVAIAVFSLVQITKLSVNTARHPSVDFFIFFGTILGYNFLKYVEVFKSRIFTFEKNYTIVLVSLLAFLGVVFIFFRLELQTQWAFLKIGFVVLIYPFVRKYSFLKMFVVAFCVTYITVYIPLLDREFARDTTFIYLLQRFLIVVCLLIPLEIVDVTIDSKTIQTLPQKIGIENTKFLGYMLLTLSLVLHFYTSSFAVDIVIFLVIAFFIFFANKNRFKYYTSFWVESIPVFWWILLLFS